MYIDICDKLIMYSGNILIGGKYCGLKFKKGNCGVSIMRSGNRLLTVLQMEKKHCYSLHAKRKAR